MESGCIPLHRYTPFNNNHRVSSKTRSSAPPSPRFEENRGSKTIPLEFRFRSSLFPFTCAAKPDPTRRLHPLRYVCVHACRRHAVHMYSTNSAELVPRATSRYRQNMARRSGGGERRDERRVFQHSLYRAMVAALPTRAMMCTYIYIYIYVYTHRLVFLSRG